MRTRMRRVRTYTCRARKLFSFPCAKMSDKMYNHISGSNNLEQDLAEKLTRESPRTSSDGEYAMCPYNFSD